jgi:hypothetical protein
MLVEQEARTVREAVGVFNRSEDLQDAIDELLSSGFDRAELSLLASEHAVEESLVIGMRKSARWQRIRQSRERPTCRPRQSEAPRAG